MKESVSYKLEGMTCDACARRIEKMVNKLEGVEAKVSFATESIYFQNEPEDLEKIQSTVEKLGYKLLLKKQERSKNEDQIGLGIGVLATTILMIPMVLMLFNLHWHYPVWIEIILSSLTLVFPGLRFFKSAYLTLRSMSANMDVLVSLGASSAYVLSLYNAFWGNSTELYFESTASILTFVGIGKFLEKKAKRNTGDAIETLLSALPTTVQKKVNDTWVETPITEIQKDDIFVVYASDMIPLDSTILEGISSINESSFTGEPLPVTKKTGEMVFAGTMNLDGKLILQAKGDVHSTRIHQIYKSLEESISSRPNIQRLVDVVSNYFILSVIFISILTFIGWYTYTRDITRSLLPAIAVLVISCPCALGLATPTAILVGNGIGASLGILFKNSSLLEELAKIDVLLFDKTGTLTKGKPNIQKIDFFFKNDKEKIYKILYQLTQSSRHPISESIFQLVNKSSKNPEEMQAIHKTYSGRGISLETKEQTYFLGSSSFIGEVAPKLSAKILNILNGNIVTYLFTKDDLLAAIYLEDAVKVGATQLLETLQREKIQTGILSGDNLSSVERFAKELSIPFFKAGLKPEDKLQEISNFQDVGKKVGMVGDGINDSPALAKANIGIGLLHGTEISKEVSDITILKDDIQLVGESIRIARATMSKIKQNLFLAFIYNMACIPLAALGVLSPMIAGAAMALSSVSVVTNSLLLKNFKSIGGKNGNKNN